MVSQNNPTDTEEFANIVIQKILGKKVPGIVRAGISAKSGIL